MLDRYTRKLKDAVLNPAAKYTGKYVSPNTVTLISFIPGVLAVYFLLTGFQTAGFWLFVLNRILDGLDGAIARQTDRQSDFGGYLDLMLDFILYAALPLAVTYGTKQPLIPLGGMTSLSDAELRLLWTAALLASFYINAASWMFLSAILEKRQQGATDKGEQTSVTMPAGMIGGTETILFYCGMMLLPSYHLWLFAVMSLLTLTAAAQRMVWALINLK